MHPSTVLRTGFNARRPNFLVIITDQQRGDALGCAWPSWRPGSSVLQTPNLDRLATGGIRFARAYVNNPLCMPGRSTLLTGLTPRGHGVRTNGIPLSRDFPTMNGALAAAGYRTHSVGKIHTRPFGIPNGADPETLDPFDYPESRAMWDRGRIAHLPEPYYGFQTTEWTGGHGAGVHGDYTNWLRNEHPEALRLLAREAGTPTASGAEQSWCMPIPPELHYNTWVADRTIAFIEGAAQRAQPFMTWASFPDPHHPFCAPEPWFSMYDRDAVPMPVRREGEHDDLAPFFRQVYERALPLSGRRAPTNIPDDQLREIIAITYGMISFVDQQVGRILTALERLGLAENTVVVFTSDHGDLMGDHWLMNKGPFHFEGLLNVPGIWRFPRRVPAGRASDALVSHLDFAPTALDLAGVPAPESGPAWPRARMETERQLRPWTGRSLVPLLTGEVDRVQDAVVVENDEDYLGLRLRTLITPAHQLTVYIGEDGEQPFGELFDREADPGQRRNLWHHPDYRGLKVELKERLLAELVRTDNRLPRRLCHA
ncbi:MAG: sulfatase-like hydrolase/transferase [Chloroflexi bacterium]|nr:sulfatase-like hydrolase/transferase [Chloroflexota bacterium]